MLDTGFYNFGYSGIQQSYRNSQSYQNAQNLQNYQNQEKNNQNTRIPQVRRGRTNIQISRNVPNSASTSNTRHDWQWYRNLQNRIIGGDQAERCQWPWLTMVKTRWICGGSILSTRFVLTAAHCLWSADFDRPLATNDVIVYAGIGNTKENVHNSRLVQTKRLEKIVIHYEWLKSKEKRERVEDDIALIKVDSDFRFDSCVQPACLPNPNFIETGQPLVGSICWITGFGDSQGTAFNFVTKQAENPDDLRHAQIPIVDNLKCSRSLGLPISDRQMCAGYENGKVDTCTGDSGGPLVCQTNLNDPYSFTLTGVVSWGFECAQANTPGVYTRVSSYLEWIKNVVNTQ